MSLRALAILLALALFAGCFAISSAIELFAL
jgi:uncharacterized lipoprotein YajG